MTRAIVSKSNATFTDLITATTQQNSTFYTVPDSERNTMVGIKGNISYSVYDTISSAGVLKMIIYRQPNGNAAAPSIPTSDSAQPICDRMADVIWSQVAVLHESDRTSYNIQIDIKTQRKMYSGDKFNVSFVTSNANTYASVAYNLNTFSLES